MPTYYPPGKRKGYPFYIVRGWIDGEQHEVRTDCQSKKGERGAEAYWENYKRGIHAERSADPTREMATMTLLALASPGALLPRQIPETLGH